MDICEILHFVIFPAICYFSLKRDCQYWSIGVDEDEETSMLGYANEVGVLECACYVHRYTRTHVVTLSGDMACYYCID